MRHTVYRFMFVLFFFLFRVRAKRRMQWLYNTMPVKKRQEYIFNSIVGASGRLFFFSYFPRSFSLITEERGGDGNIYATKYFRYRRFWFVFFLNNSAKDLGFLQKTVMTIRFTVLSKVSPYVSNDRTDQI